MLRFWPSPGRLARGRGEDGSLFTIKAARRPISVLSVLALLAGVAVITPNPVIPFAESAAAAANEVLILGSTVTGGTASLEAQRITADGYTPVVVDDPTWESMTTAQFASYRAIVIGDPTCGSYNDTSHLTAALSNPATWGAAVNGNVLIIGTDPVFHSGGTLTSGPGQLVAHGIDFALAQAGKVGAYIDLSCAYGTVPPNTPLTLLDGLRPGGFSVDGGPSTVCYNAAHIVATHPALAGLTDAQLSNWGCSVHEAFDTWPADYTVLAIALNFGSTFTASDGTIGTPYILASGAGLHSYPLSLAPTAQNVPVGTSATVTASLLDTATGSPAPGVAVSFRVQAGPNAGTTGNCVPSTCLTDSNGNVNWTYTGANPGSDTVQAWLDTNLNGVPDPGEAQTTAGVTWTAPVGPTAPSQSGGGSPSASPPSSCQNIGHPVNCATGEMWHRVLDLSVPGRGLGLWLVRTYSSTLAGQDGPLGFGWTHGYNMSLTVAGDGSVTVHEEGGSAIGFAPNGAGGYSSATWVFATLARNADGTYTLRRKNQTSFVFTSSGKLVQEQDRNGHPTTLSYSNGQLATVTDSSGRQLQFQYSGSRISKITDPVQRSVAFQYDGTGNLVSATDVAAGVTRFSYDANHLMLTMTDPNGGMVSNTYDSSGRVVTQSDAMNRTTNWAYGAGTTTITDPMGNMTKEAFQNGQLVSLTKGFGTSLAATWTMTYDPKTFTLASATDPNNHTTSMVSDANGNALSVTDPLSRKWTFTYDSRNDPVSATDPMGVATQLTYDGNGNPIGISTAINGTQAVTKITYDPSNPGDAISLKDPDGNTFQFTHDQFGNVSKAVDALGNAVTFTYDAASRLIRSFSPRGGATAYTYNAFDDVLSVTDPLGHVTTYQYDANRNATAVTDANGRTSRNVFDLDNEQLNTTRADGSQVRNVYNADGLLSSQIDGLGHATTYTYDPQNRLATATDALSRVTTVGYDAAGNHTSVTDAKGQKTSVAYDAANQLTTITYSDGKTPSVAYQYDGDGRRIGMSDGTGSTSYAYDGTGHLIQSVNGAGAKVGYGYDLRGDLTRLTYPDGSQVSRTFDADGRLATVTDSLGHTTSFAYDANGNLVTENFPNGVRTNMGYDAADRLTKISDTGPQGQIVFTQGRDSLGQLTSESIAGAPPNGPVSFGYDQVNRLTSANYGIAQLGYQYDAANRLTQTSSAAFGSSIVSALSYDNADQLLSLTRTHGAQVLQTLQFSYDANGNRIQKTDQGGAATNYGYDQANRLTSFGTVAQYAYNGDGLRMSKTVTGVSESFAWNLVAPVPILIQDGTTRYVTGPDGLPLEQISANGTIRYYHQDELGSTRALTNAQGKVDTVYLYDPYGNTISASGSNAANPFQFAGQYTDAESGFQYLNARYYDPSTANFLTRDPATALSQAAYGYAHDSPLNYADPTGFGFSLSGVAQWFWDNAGTISTVFGLLGFIFSETAALGAVFDGISMVAGFVQGIKDITKGEPWWKIAWDFAGPLATAIKFISGAIKLFYTLLGDLKEGQALANAAKNAVRAAAADIDLMLVYDRVAALATSVQKISDTVGNVLMFADLGIKLIMDPPAAAPSPTAPAMPPVSVALCP